MTPAPRPFIWASTFLEKNISTAKAAIVASAASNETSEAGTMKRTVVERNASINETRVAPAAAWTTLSQF